MAVLRLCGFGCEMPIWANFGEFLEEFDPSNCEIVVLSPKVRTSRGDTRFDILHVKISPAVSSVALFKYYHYVKKN